MSPHGAAAAGPGMKPRHNATQHTADLGATPLIERDPYAPHPFSRIRFLTAQLWQLKGNFLGPRYPGGSGCSISPERKIGTCATSCSDVIAVTAKYSAAIEAKSRASKGAAALADIGRPSRRFFCKVT